jgi:hypothetical protein
MYMHNDLSTSSSSTAQETARLATWIDGSQMTRSSQQLDMKRCRIGEGAKETVFGVLLPCLD